MRAPHPALQRLFGQASAAARQAAAWRALDAVAARLDPALAGPAEAAAASLAAWGPGQQLAARLGPLLDRILGGSPAPEAEAPGPQARLAQHAPGGPDEAAPQGRLPAGGLGLAPALARQPVSAPALAGRPPASPWPSRPARAGWPVPRARLPDAPQAASAAVVAASAAPSANRDAPASLAFAGQGGGASAARPAPQILRLLGASSNAPDDAPVRHDKPAASAQWQQRISRAGLAAAWQAPMSTAHALHTTVPSPGLAVSPLPASLLPHRPASADGVDAPAPAAPADRLASTLGRLAGPALATRRAPADTFAPAAALPPAPAPYPTAWPAGRSVGGFKGLAALGRPAVVAEPVAQATGQTDQGGVAAIPRPATAPSAWPAPGGVDDAQQVVDQVEAALREQAERSGIVLSRGWT